MDIVERLRKLVILDEVGSDNPLGRDAADEIERLREALKQILNPDNFENIFEIAEAALYNKR